MTIGVFDSGHGGLTILRALARLSDRSFLYFGDHAQLPYGDRPSSEIVDLTRQGAELLFKRGCRLVVLACNTAAAVALRTLQQEWLIHRYPDHRILGVLVPTVEAVTGVPWSGSPPENALGRAHTIGIFATRRTVESRAYVEEISKRDPSITVVQQACPGLVDLIEKESPAEVLTAAVQGYVAALTAQLGTRRLDAALLGCTHYPLVAEVFAKALPPHTRVLAQPELVAASLTDYLNRHPQIDVVDENPTMRFLTSGDEFASAKFATRFLGRPADFIAVRRAS